MKKTLIKKKTYVNAIPLNKKDIEINTLGVYIEQKVSYGLAYNEISLPDQINLFELILYILNKAIRTHNDLICLRYFLSSFPKLKKSFDGKASLSDSHEVINKVSMFIQCEEFQKNEIVFLNGEIGDRFYIIFKGEVSVLVPSEEEVKLTVEEYLDYLNRLIVNKEYELFYLTLNSNRSIYMSKDITAMSFIALNDSKVLRGKLNTIDYYIKRIEPIKLSNELLGLSFKVWKYHNMCQLNDGFTFGDIALGYESKKRTATIIASKHSFIGSLKKDIYISSIKESIDKLRKLSLDMLLNNRLFQGMNHDIFDRAYFNFFKAMTFYHLENIFTQGDSRKEIYFLRSGEIEISINSSLNDLNIIIEDLGGYPSTRLKSMIDNIPKMVKFCKKKKLFRVYDIGEKDVIGLEEYVINKTNQFFCSAKVKSDKCEVFALEISFFEKIIQSDKRLQNNYLKDINIRKQLMNERINKLKEITVQTHFRNYHSNSLLTFDSPLKVSTPKLFEMTTNISNRNRFSNNLRESTFIKDCLNPLLATEYYQSENYLLIKINNSLKQIHEIKNKFLGLTRNERTINSYKSVPLGKHLQNKVTLFNTIVDKLLEKKEERSTQKERRKHRLYLVDCLVLDRYIETITCETNRSETLIKQIKTQNNTTLSNETNVTRYNSKDKTQRKTHYNQPFNAIKLPHTKIKLLLSKKK